MTRKKSAPLRAVDVSSKRLLAIARRVLLDPGSATRAEIRSLAGSVLSQAPNRPQKTEP